MSKPSTCHPTKPTIANGLCSTCYKKDLFLRNPGYKDRQYAANIKWLADHPEYHSKRSKRRWATNPEPLRAAKRKWCQNNPKKMARYKKEWKRVNPDKYLKSMRADVKKRKALKKGAKISDFTSKQWEQLKLEHNFRCFYCKLTPDKLTQDHKIPLSRKGNHTYTNIVPACLSCNLKKNNKTTEEFLNALETR